jgi:hypothetical protein
MPDNHQTADAAWTWSAILTLAFSTGVFTAVFNQGIAWLKETRQSREKDRRTAKASALLLVEMLTSYAQECNSRSSYNRYDKYSGTGYGRYSDMPVLPPYPEGVEWAVLPSKIAAGLRDLRNEVNEAKRDIDEAAEVVDPDEAADVATDRCVVIGYMALRISRRLRKYYGFGPYQAAGESNFASELHKYYRESRRGRLRRFWESLPVYRVRRRLRRRLSRWRLQLMKALRPGRNPGP